MWPLASKLHDGLGDSSSKLDSLRQVERRAWVRHECRLGTFFLTNFKGEVCYSGIIRHISPGGINLVSARVFEPKTHLFLLLKTVVEARVIHASASSDGEWVLGCAFIKELAEEELHGLLGDRPLACGLRIGAKERAFKNCTS